MSKKSKKGKNSGYPCAWKRCHDTIDAASSHAAIVCSESQCVTKYYHEGKCFQAAEQSYQHHKKNPFQAGGPCPQKGCSGRIQQVILPGQSNVRQQEPPDHKQNDSLEEFYAQVEKANGRAASEENLRKKFSRLGASELRALQANYEAVWGRAPPEAQNPPNRPNRQQQQARKPERANNGRQPPQRPQQAPSVPLQGGQLVNYQDIASAILAGETEFKTIPMSELPTNYIAINSLDLREKWNNDVRKFLDFLQTDLSSGPLYLLTAKDSFAGVNYLLAELSTTKAATRVKTMMTTQSNVAVEHLEWWFGHSYFFRHSAVKVSDEMCLTIDDSSEKPQPKLVKMGQIVGKGRQSREARRHSPRQERRDSARHSEHGTESRRSDSRRSHPRDNSDQRSDRSSRHQHEDRRDSQRRSEPNRRDNEYRRDNRHSELPSQQQYNDYHESRERSQRNHFREERQDPGPYNNNNNNYSSNDRPPPDERFSARPSEYREQDSRPHGRPPRDIPPQSARQEIPRDYHDSQRYQESHNDPGPRNDPPHQHNGYQQPLREDHTQRNTYPQERYESFAQPAQRADPRVVRERRPRPWLFANAPRTPDFSRPSYSDYQGSRQAHDANDQPMRSTNAHENETGHVDQNGRSHGKQAESRADQVDDCYKTPYTVGKEDRWIGDVFRLRSNKQFYLFWGSRDSTTFSMLDEQNNMGTFSDMRDFELFFSLRGEMEKGRISSDRCIQYHTDKFFQLHPTHQANLKDIVGQNFDACASWLKPR